MALYVIGDTHFSEAVCKPMDIFGGRWVGAREKLLSGLGDTLKSEDDMLVICGDFSWGMTLEEALADFKLLAAFPGKKVLLKGNHDYWWQTMRKMVDFLQINRLCDLQFLHNNSIFYKETALCGTRGWFYDQNETMSAQDQKIFLRELIRLESSLQSARAQKPGCEIYCFLHYPPVCGDFEITRVTDLLKKYAVSRCFYGHLHGDGLRGAFCGNLGGVDYRAISADALGFRPVMIKP